MINTNCLVCGIGISRAVVTGKQKCNKCSRRHYNRKGSETNKRSKSHSARIQKYSREIYLLYSSCCAICKWRITSEPYYLKMGSVASFGNEIHHILKVCDGGDDSIENLILLCPNHHKQADRGFISPEELRLYQANYKEKEKIISNSINAIDEVRLTNKSAEDFL